MNARILELIKQPQLIQKDDVALLDKELKNQPYLQSLRALKLMGTHKFFPENYNSVLSETAAFTTDKKILYQLIFGKPKKVEEAQPLVSEEVSVEKVEEAVTPSETNVLSENTEEIPVAMGIVLEEEELEVVNFDEATELQSSFTDEVQNDEKIEIVEEVNAQKIEVDKEEVFETDRKEEEATSLSFQEMEAFLPNIKFKTPDTELKIESNIKSEVVKGNIVEEQKSVVTEETPLEVLVESMEDKLNDSRPQLEENLVSEWKPMSIETHLPDALIGKSKPSLEFKEEVKEEPILVENNNTEILVKEETLEDLGEESEERQALNVSFFSDTPAPIDTVIAAENQQLKVEESNIPSFINTWQNWLKIDRTAVSEVDKKSQIIDKFIETNPSIAKVDKHTPIKEEKEFVIKEKGDDISHLMTETLAQLYVEQHLYTKAIEAYGILQNKYPEKVDIYAEKIEEIKQMRMGGRA
ncbi:hypothetical protein [Riemerella anatipestifer]|uniref:Uncharacterized protein n=1 Tax=Riemerella anatipestifer (strain ATCC 11845 / DSM 15868 / JCM 9532 / NCTC 11014) TaxID=693978 RepID=E4TCH8_RIEAD|nr:hypothetical protein [Riemerella anatipestifer]ADQ82487.1 hypothetical protein Riean_1330 [Riemerella anatipestifer ATCC 11845 = DSM 15868]ADZ12018.1 hypothetical protein RIA_0885 [Riemerella anatipestifer RA-GD]AFD56493.1 hypothetical protein RA0C_1606 [Riemerella anatipestifer ATCC 11845 = DSM 15868]AGC39577.1 hypothetical protein G148_0272 [Riemerella anatipestifer RA-CH-2]AKP69682.1 hypothetical protein CG08_1482 [Riemerella anatipestifer]